MELSGQVAIVTGAGRGIGRATALELARMGADIVVAELDRAGAERTAAEVKGLGRRVSVVPTDVTVRAHLATMAERTRAEFGRIDILVNNAGVYRAAAPLDVTEEHRDAVLSVNPKAVVFGWQAVPRMPTAASSCTEQNNLPATRLTRRAFRDSPPFDSGIPPIVPAGSEAHSGLSHAGDRRAVRGEAPNEDCNALGFQPFLRVARPRRTRSRRATLLAGHGSFS